ncbi:hypothetical protein G7Y89_g6083 [Cudoniella acicularis]|uniref:Uncharacterized protein n=1 Tax=Cudoniella acicularis TaxID=354080 RepID=A0A8H4RNL1_9HELO|nr:hypothetical protein G7Y89_g6083 [Cudoniella acicularis]
MVTSPGLSLVFDSLLQTTPTSYNLARCLSNDANELAQNSRLTRPTMVHASPYTTVTPIHFRSVTRYASEMPTPSSYTLRSSRSRQVNYRSEETPHFAFDIRVVYKDVINSLSSI